MSNSRCSDENTRNSLNLSSKLSELEELVVKKDHAISSYQPRHPFLLGESNKKGIIQSKTSLQISPNTSRVTDMSQVVSQSMSEVDIAILSDTSTDVIAVADDININLNDSSD